ncbi:cytochrome P450 [Rhodococcus sp. X156]|uniref:cytochrome P450 n=1 Tax=Rhodococcus sp. X156 TaxID=2499145 RepID=UPI001F4968AC|nr:cytochrome P450 [Rhodococcus sp. X156]
MSTSAAPSVPLDYPFAPVAASEAAERYRQIAADRPMTKVTMPFGGEAWVIHRTAAARSMLRDRRFVREPFRTGERVVPYFVEFPDFLKATLQFEDPPEHTKLRRLVQQATSPRAVQAMRDAAVVYANELIDTMVAAGTSANLVHDYAVPLPMQMLSNLLGVPMADRVKFERWSSSMLAVAGMTEEEVMTNMIELGGYMAALIETRRNDPAEDLLSVLAHATDTDDSLSDQEILSIALLLIIAGFDNTANFICLGVLSLLNHAGARELLMTDVDGLAPTAVEEILRRGRFEMGLDVPGGGGLVPLLATEDVEIDGQLVAQGEAVLVDPAATAHDGIALPDPSTFDITREHNPHLTLSYGLHHCLGAPLARMEMQVAIAELFKRLPQLRLAGTPTINYDHLSQPISVLPVSW